MINDNVGGNNEAVAIGGASDNAISANDSVQYDAQASDSTEATSAEGAAQTATDPAQAAADTFLADQFALKFRGKTIVPKTKEELLNYAQRGYNYDQRVKEVSEREARLKDQETRYGQVAQLSDLFEQNPEFKAAVYDIFHRFQSGQISQGQANAELSAESQQSDIERHPVVQQLREKLDRLETGYKSWEEKQATEAVEKEIEEIKTAHADEDWTTPDAETGETLEIELLKHADKNGFKNLEQAYRDLRYDQIIANTKAQALKDAEAAKAQAAKAGVVAKGGNAQTVPQKTIPRTATYDQIAQQALMSMK